MYSDNLRIDGSYPNSNFTSASAMPPTTAPILSPGVESMTFATVTIASSHEHGRSSPVLSFTLNLIIPFGN